ncbi:MAG: exonuclease domain-containing protein [Acidiferrobacteraceae bacterium]
MLDRLFPLEYRRRRLARRTAPGPLQNYLSTPFPDPGRDCREVEYLALDLETTGLEPQTDAIVSVGMVTMYGTRIDLATAEHRVVRVERPMSERSVVVHRLTDDRVAAGEPLHQALADVLTRLAGRVLLVHYAPVETEFLRRACAKVFHGDFTARVVDTQQLARRWLERRNQPYRATDLRLFNLRTRYNLPRYVAHNALSDALACAELFAAQIAERESGRAMPLKDFLVRI